MAVCVLIHGFTGGPWEVEPLAEELRKRGHFAAVPQLAGHGGGRPEMKASSREDWRKSAKSAFAEALSMSERVHIAGFSMGSLLAAELAAQNRKNAASLIMAAPPLFALNLPEMAKTVLEADKRKNYWTKFKSTPLKATAEFRKTVKEAKRAIGEVEAPLLVMQGGSDHLVRSKSADFALDSAKSGVKEMRFFPRSGHLLFHGPDAKEAVGAAADFIEINAKT